MYNYSVRNKKIAIVTPFKNEVENIPDLIRSIESQNTKIALWVFINDASTDGSEKFVKENILKLKNVEDTLLFNTSNLIKDYKLGDKYSKIVNYGFEKLTEYQYDKSIKFDYIGILDADCKLNSDYYSNLFNKFCCLPKLGIASGIIYYRKRGKRIFEKVPQRWARGGIRLWRKECFNECGYIVGNSADALSTAYAWTKGWYTQSFHDSVAEARESGSKGDHRYYGKSAYYRYVPLYHVILKSFFFILMGKLRMTKNYFCGYVEAMKEKKREKINNKKIIKYFKLLPLRILIENIIVLRNKLIIWSTDHRIMK